MIAKLREGVQRLQLPLEAAQLDALEVYIQAILQFNKSYNLMKAESPDELAVNHILDSLAAYHAVAGLIAELRQRTGGDVRMGDIGSGGGCPGIPLAVAFPDVHITLVERMEKRSAFLEQTVARLRLANVDVCPLQAEKVAPGSFDIVVFRAFHPFDKKISATLRSMLKEGGFIAAYKARSEKIAAEMEAVRDVIPAYKKIVLTVPFLEDHERNLVIIQK
ncbi:MAG TPA: 16S rRNA (guanine(527)-N(7))-methyltransferase RsmG [Treponema sp.]|nr:16S rRNA (guanine(527)-N(7))-methyltransferase RsmG [Treponema sp.]